MSSISTFMSGFSTLLWLRRVTAPFPISPEQENLTPSFEASIETVKERVSYVSADSPGHNIPDSDRAMRSLQILLNSEEGMLMVAAYSVSGIPKCS